MKKSKIIIPALGMLVLSTAATVSGTVAWFTMNTTAKAEGMVVSAKTSGSLIIKEMDLEHPALPTASDKGTKVVFADDDLHAFYPSTHDLTTAPVSGLKYVTNANNVNFETGTRMNGLDGTGGTVDTTLLYDDVGSNQNYYHDYGVYLAGDGMSMSKALTISIDNAAVLTANGALSIDFYGKAFTANGKPTISDTFLGTLNLAKVENVGDDGTQAKVNIVTPSAITIGNSNPTKADYGAYGILMRVYYDGALIQRGESGNTHATYLACTSSDTFNSNILYYTDANGTAIYPADSNTDLDGLGLYYVDIDNDTICYARSIKFAEISQQSISVSFSC